MIGFSKAATILKLLLPKYLALNHLILKHAGEFERIRISSICLYGCKIKKISIQKA
jgi:hypothetical protein